MNEPLSEREIEILRLAADGCANGEIAARLSLSLNTVKWYSKRIYEKLAVENRTQAIKRAQSLGLLAEDTPSTQAAPPQNNLPTPLTTFVGRRGEIDTIKQLLKQHRLLTLTGPGGIGKTRLALQVATEMSWSYPDGVCFVELAPINEAEQVLNTIAYQLSTTETPNTPLLPMIQATLRDKQFLLVLDNFEHLLDATPLVTDLLAVCSKLTVLATSRERLALYGEQEYGVPPLQLPDLDGFAASHLAPLTLLASEALQLFERCAQAVYPDFRLTVENVFAVASLCLRLDGLPLAIELAAAYSKLLSPQAMLTQLDSMWLEMRRSLRNVPTRQQTLRNTIEWSYRLHNPEERQLFAQLAVFRGGATWEAIVAVCIDHTQETALVTLFEPLNGLVNKSLVWQRAGEHGESRFGMLETIREFALRCLQESGHEAQTRRQHMLYYLAMAEQARPNLRQVEQVRWLRRLGQEHHNLRAALHWALDDGAAEIIVRMCWSLWGFWWFRSYLSEGPRWAEQVLVHKAQLPLPLRIRAEIVVAGMFLTQGDLVACEQKIGELQELSRQVGRDALAEGFAYCCIGLIALLRGDWSQALHNLPISITLFEEAGEEPLAAMMHSWTGTAHLLAGDDAQALPYFETGLAHAQQVGDHQGITTALFNLGQIALVRNELEVAKQRFAEGLPYVQALEDRAQIAAHVEGLAAVAGAASNYAQAAQLFGAAEVLFERAGIRGNIFYQPYYARYVTIRKEVEQALGSASYTALWHTGWAMTLTEMIAFALSASI
ncbi:MAG: LuxR C-terminal-related transcriptional regulator [Caldilineaceae bacterium]